MTEFDRLEETGPDVTGWEAATENLRKSEERFRAVFDNAPAVIVLADTANQFVMVNRAFTAAYGLTTSQVLGKRSAVVFGEGTAAVIETQLAQVRERRASISFDLDVTYADGSHHTHAVNRFPIFDSDDRITGFGAIATDITERRRIEEAVRESESRYRNLAEQSPDAIAVHRDLMVVYANKAFLALLGYDTVEDVLGRHLFDFVGPEWHDVIRCRAARIRKEGLALPVIELGMRRRDGSRVIVEAKADSVPFSGEVAVQSLFRDVTEKRESERALRETEERIRAIMDHAPMAIVMKDREGRFVTVNDQFLARAGLRRGDVIGKVEADIRAPEFAEQITAIERNVLKTLKAQEFEIRLRHADGTEHDYFTMKFPVNGTDGNVVGIGTISTEITDYKKAREEARRLHMELAHVSRVNVMGEMGAGVAHELNQPLTAINNFAKGCLMRLQRGEIGGSELTPILVRISKEAERAGGIIRRIRGFIRKEAREPKPVGIVSIANEVVALLGNEAICDGIVLEIDGSIGEDVVVADSVEIFQVLFNLVRNAIEARPGTPEHAGRVRISIADDGPEDIVVEVSDNGGGIPDSVRERLFEPFFTTKTDGMGMGLSICRRIVEEYGGRLSIHSREGEGTTVAFTLPRQDRAPVLWME